MNSVPFKVVNLAGDTLLDGDAASMETVEDLRTVLTELHTLDPCDLLLEQAILSDDQNLCELVAHASQPLITVMEREIPTFWFLDNYHPDPNPEAEKMSQRPQIKKLGLEMPTRSYHDTFALVLGPSSKFTLYREESKRVNQLNFKRAVICDEAAFLRMDGCKVFHGLVPPDGDGEFAFETTANVSIVQKGATIMLKYAADSTSRTIPVRLAFKEDGEMRRFFLEGPGWAERETETRRDEQAAEAASKSAKKQAAETAESARHAELRAEIEASGELYPYPNAKVIYRGEATRLSGKELLPGATGNIVSFRESDGRVRVRFVGIGGTTRMPLSVLELENPP